MQKADLETVAAYIASHPAGVQAILKRIHNTIRKAVPGARESISYQIPAYQLPEGPVLYFAGWKRHYSLYPATASLVAAFKRDLASYEISKGTIRFPFSEPVPVRLIERIAKFRAKEAVSRAKGKQSKTKAGRRRSSAGPGAARVRAGRGPGPGGAPRPRPPSSG